MENVIVELQPTARAGRPFPLRDTHDSHGVMMGVDDCPHLRLKLDLVAGTAECVNCQLVWRDWLKGGA